MKQSLLETVVDLDASARDPDVHNASTAIAVVPEGFLDGLREPEFTSHEASTRPRAGAVLWALDEAGQMHVERAAEGALMEHHLPKVQVEGLVQPEVQSPPPQPSKPRAEKPRLKRRAPPPVPTAKPAPLTRAATPPPTATHDDSPVLEIVAVETERPPFGSLPEIDLGDALVELRASRSTITTPGREQVLPPWLSAMLVAAAVTTVALGWAVIVSRFIR